MAKNEKYGIAAVDIGTSKVAALMFSAELGAEPVIEGYGVVPSAGVKKGLITDAEAAGSAVSSALAKAEDMAKLVANQAVVGLGGKHISSMRSYGMIPLEKGPRRITQEDVDRLITYAGIVRLPDDASLLGIVPRDIIVDGQKGVEKPVGMSAVRMETDAVVLTASSQQLEACDSIFKSLGTQLAGKYANSICAAEAVLSPDEKEWGAAVVDIGAGTTDIAIYMDRSLVRLTSIPLGSANITKDIAQVLQVPVNQAEQLKVKFGTARPALIDKNEIIDAVNMATGVDASIGSAISRTELCKVIEARVFQIIDQVAAEIDAEGLLGRLPSGMVLTGGGSLLPYLPEFIQENLKVPAKVARPSQSLGLPKQIEFPQMSAAAGLIKTCLMDHRAAGDASSQKNQRRMGRGVKDLLKGLIDLN